MNEIWKTIDFNSDYEVSNLGNVRSNKRKKPHLLKPFRRGGIKKDEHNRGDYLSVRLLNNGTAQDYAVHRLVAMAFIPNTNNYPQVNHINGIRNDNRVENLEWCDNSYNIWHSYNVLRGDGCVERAVVQYDVNGKLICEYKSVHEAEIKTGVNKNSILGVCKKEPCRKTAGGFIWRHKGDEDVAIKYDKTSPVVQISKYGEIVKRFSTVQDAAIEVGITEGGISGVCLKRSRGYNYAGGYIWRYEEGFDEKEFGYFLDKTFVQMTINNIFVAEYQGTHDLVDNSKCELIKVIMCCRGQRKSTNGFKWCIKEEGDKTRITKREKEVVQLTKDFSFVGCYKSAVEASKHTKICATNINFSCKHNGKYHAGGFKWLYKTHYDKLYNLVENKNQ